MNTHLFAIVWFTTIWEEAQLTNSYVVPVRDIEVFKTQINGRQSELTVLEFFELGICDRELN